MFRVNRVQLQKNLNEVQYPVSKKDLIFYAEEKGVDERVLRALRHLPNQQYETATDVSQAMGMMA
ncbi:DUF2795 domain-containing protein [Tolypothrix bouteillei VB521301]|uniref:DUF2795 domain-containing protein n=3 Tax=Nostocales TaxID=1161 RepID=A0A0C1NCJ4_9CYAN|nr:DUF2795 domain-containing protein [Tolypothrix bouteillei VB521301]